MTDDRKSIRYMSIATLKAEGGPTSFDAGASKPTEAEIEAQQRAWDAEQANYRAKTNAALLAITSSPGWQPIETAPIDGTWVLLSGAPIYFDAYDQVPPAVVGFWRHDDWVYAHWDGGWGSGYEATKWRPL